VLSAAEVRHWNVVDYRIDLTGVLEAHAPHLSRVAGKEQQRIL
jgi:hypothetical protein